MFGIFRVRSLRKKAMSGDSDAQCDLGYTYDIGKGVKQDYAKAVEWYRKAAEQGHKSAQNNLGVMYENGKGVKQDYTKAIEWYRKAAEQGHERAQNNLGLMYVNGKGVSLNNIEAGKFFFLAAKAGLQNAKKNLNALYADLNLDFSITNKIKAKNREKPDEAFMEALLEASRRGNIQEVKSLLSSGKDVNFRYNTLVYYENPLITAVDHGHTGIVRLLLEGGAYINFAEDYEPLNKALNKGDVEIVKLLIEAGANVNTCRTDGKAPLEIISYDFIDNKIKSQIVKLLLVAGAYPDPVEHYNGHTPLINASIKGNSEIVQLLLEAGASINITDKAGKTPLDWATQLGHAEVVKLLTETESSKIMQEKVKETKLPSSVENNNSMEKGVSSAEPPLEIEDVRSNPDEEGEIILNLWYVQNQHFIYELRAKAYVASGSDDEKLRFLRTRATHDYYNAQVYQIPEGLKTETSLFDGKMEIGTGKMCTHEHLELMGGDPVLFRDILQNVNAAGFSFNPRQAMVCITALEKDKDGKLTVRIDHINET